MPAEGGQMSERRLVVASDLSAMRGIITSLNRWMAEDGLSTRQMHTLALGLCESLTNAIIHGNKENPEKKVTVVYVRDEGSVRLSVADEGDGYAEEVLRDPLAQENLLSESGRGVFLMRRMFDKVYFNDTRNVIHLVLNADLGEAAAEIGDPAEATGNVELSTEERGDVLVGRIEGVESLSSYNAAELREALALCSCGARKLVLDMSAVELIDTSGIGELVAFQRRLAKRGAALKLAAITPYVRTVFETVELPNVIDICETVEDAVDSFSKP